MKPSYDKKDLVSLKRIIVDKFKEEHWHEFGILSDSSDIINGHSRLLRSLSWGDEDYAGNVLDVLVKICDTNQDGAAILKNYVNENFGDVITEFSGNKHVPESRKITFSPSVFKVPEVKLEENRVAAMMPFSGFDGVYNAMAKAANLNGMIIDRADTIWGESTFMQDIFNLIFKSNIIIADLTGKNPNVMYELGIAHTLGRHVIPITQNLSDIPSDLGHHRALKYHNNEQGLDQLASDLKKRLGYLYSPPSL